MEADETAPEQPGKSQLSLFLNSRFVGPAGGTGGGVFVNATVIPGTCSQGQSCAVSVTSSDFEQNTADTGSALLVVSDVLQVNISDSKFTSNAAVNGQGGAVYVTSADFGVRTVGMALTNTTFTSNYASQNGGAISMEDVADAYISNCTISSCTAWRRPACNLPMQRAIEQCSG